MYASGYGAERDPVKACMWFNLAILGYPASDEQLREKVKVNRDRLAADMTTEQVDQALKLAQEWKPKV